MARKSLLDFICYINTDYIVSEFSKNVCSALEQFLIDQSDGLRPLLVLQAPPQHGKSDIVSRYLPSWIFGKNPDISIGALSYGKDLASDMNRDVQRIMMSDEYAKIFPAVCLNSRRVLSADVEPKRNSETFEIVGNKGRYYSQGVGGPLTGKRLDIGIVDDPIKNAKEALSKTVKDGIWNWYVTTFLTRLSKNSGQIIMATAWAVDDLAGRVQKEQKRAKVLKFQAINENGEALIPELHPIEKLLETKQAMSEFFWSAMYQQNPVVLGGNLIKSAWFGQYSVLPMLKYRIIYADTAQKTKEHNDYSVFECWGSGEDNKIYLIDMIRGKWEAPDLERMAISFWQKHSAEDANRLGSLRQMKIEDKASGTGLIQNIRANGRIPIEGIERNRDKYTRLLDVVGYIKSGYVMLPENAPFLSDFLIECESFSGDDTHAHDDQVDPMIDAINDMLAGANELAIWENIR